MDTFKIYKTFEKEINNQLTARMMDEVEKGNRAIQVLISKDYIGYFIRIILNYSNETYSSQEYFEVDNIDDLDKYVAKQSAYEMIQTICEED